ncbi:zinc ribbon domain-containing protein [Limosilactobacillus reuteri]|uniref:zinc ribbon domain-containing protein n=1 Tax=Limosilactobacillus reuteri TaxID=1598 RepID=UPI001E31D152|nr:zinc ribbon domain-containing protein [Limosilactobacillus reuteri]MCC4328709.1 zinc ribbon domain-containing protein [Limosilactobacillus reuteri]MCC4336606.1 zinc ribbon domain-containing protein [Limosilactobacillus reuteri]MCC4338938.1 zinc ribbon domain-containing protein [Limosilactobacillus reuteri]MCC4347448.1 zinc ribbon domain-containing protein [Limosilactobacillus reuteri]MCC4374524.1 zinc ribbon domain-containing protein [Limosilactobacillus reuteri]
MKKCPYCNTLNPDDAEVCENCGKPLKGQMLALVCPNCGKVNALGSRECSVCHTKLNQSNNQLVSREITPRKNNKRWGYVALIAFGLLIALFIYLGGRYARSTYIPGKIEALEFEYYDGNRKLLYKDYYIFNSTDNLSQTNFSIAYLGKNSSGKNPLRLATLKIANKLYRENKHYTFYCDGQTGIISGPQKIFIKDGAKMISRRIGHHDKFRPDPKGYLCKIEGDNRVKFTNINILNLIDDD